MAGVKGRSGGARPGAGRKPKPICVNGYEDPLVFLRAVWTGEIEANPAQIDAAKAALPYVHQKLGEGGKKAVAQEEAERVANRFAPIPAPKLVVNNG